MCDYIFFTNNKQIKLGLFTVPCSSHITMCNLNLFMPLGLHVIYLPLDISSKGQEVTAFTLQMSAWLHQVCRMSFSPSLEMVSSIFCLLFWWESQGKKKKRQKFSIFQEKLSKVTNVYQPNYYIQNKEVGTCNYKAIVLLCCNDYTLNLWSSVL